MSTDDPARDKDDASSPSIPDFLPTESELHTAHVRQASPGATAGEGGIPAPAQMSQRALCDQAHHLVDRIVVYSLRRVGETEWVFHAGKLSRATGAQSYLVCVSAAYNHLPFVEHVDHDAVYELPTDGYCYGCLVDAAVWTRLKAEEALSVERSKFIEATSRNSDLEEEMRQLKESFVTFSAKMQSDAKAQAQALSQAKKDAQAQAQLLAQMKAQNQKDAQAHAQKLAQAQTQMFTQMQTQTQPNPQTPPVDLSEELPSHSLPAAPVPLPVALMQYRSAADLPDVRQWAPAMAADAMGLCRDLQVKFLAGKDHMPGGDLLASNFHQLRCWVLATSSTAGWIYSPEMVGLGTELLLQLRTQHEFVVRRVSRMDIQRALLKLDPDDRFAQAVASIPSKTRAPGSSGKKYHSKSGNGKTGGR